MVQKVDEEENRQGEPTNIYQMSQVGRSIHGNKIMFSIQPQIFFQKIKDNPNKYIDKAHQIPQKSDQEQSTPRLIKLLDFKDKENNQVFRQKDEITFKDQKKLSGNRLLKNNI